MSVATIAQLVTHAVVIVVGLHVILVCCAYSIMLERKLSAWMQDRVGPNRTGPKGMLQPLAAGVHEWRMGRAKQLGLPNPGLEESQKFVALLSAVAFTQALTGPALLNSVGLTQSPSDGFMSWVTELLEQKT